MARKAFKIPFGLRGHRLYHVDEVANGLACGCICPACKKPLEARNAGQVRRHYFAHSKDIDCPGGLETAVHRMAKQLITDHKCIVTPEFHKIPALDIYGRHYEDTPIHRNPKSVTFDRVDIEENLNAYRPDVIGEVRGRRLLIEIRVHHAVNDDKCAKVKADSEAMIEIDLRNLSEEALLDRKLFEQKVLDDPSNRHWIYNPVMEAEYESALQKLRRRAEEDERQQLVRDEKQARRKKVRTEIEQRKAELFEQHRQIARVPYLEDLNVLQHLLKNAKRRTLELHKAAMAQWPRIAKELGAEGKQLPTFLDIAVSNEWQFDVHRTLWQSFIFKVFIHERPVGCEFNLHEVVSRVVGRFGMPESLVRLAKIKREANYKGQQTGPSFLTDQENLSIPSPDVLVAEYLKKLSRFGFLKSFGKERYRIKLNSITAREQVEQERCAAQEAALRTHQKTLEQQRAEMRGHLNQRALEIAASDARLIGMHDGKGWRCQRCRFAFHWPSENQCPYCGYDRLEPLQLTTSDAQNARFRHGCDPRTRTSLEAILPERLPVVLQVSQGENSSS